MIVQTVFLILTTPQFRFLLSFVLFFGLTLLSFVLVKKTPIYIYLYIGLIVAILYVLFPIALGINHNRIDFYPKAFSRDQIVIPKSNSNLIVTIILGAVILILLVILFLNHSSKKKKLSSFESNINELKDRLVHDTDIQNQSIRHHETQLKDARQIIALLESKNSDITKQYSEEVSLTAVQITDYQNDLKTANSVRIKLGQI